MISARAYARHRGVDPKTVRQAIEEGRCPATRGAAGEWLIDPVRADAEWRDNTHPGRGGRRARGKVTIPGTGELVDPDASTMPPPAAPAPPAEADRTENIESYAKSAARLQHYKAALAQIEFEIETGALVPKAKIDREIFQFHRTLRDRILNIPDRVAAILAAEQDQVKIHAILSRELRQVLTALADEADKA